MEKEYRICNRCVMDTSDPEILFDENGNCNHCNEFLEKTSKRVYQGEKTDKELKQLVEKIKKDGKKYEFDCLIGVSGGIDSSYVAYLVKDLGLRPLAVHMDNGWNSEEAVLNIKNICNKLNIEYQSYVLDWEVFKDVQLSVLKSSIVEVEIPTDVAIPAALHKIAAENNIKYIVSGGNFATEGILPDKWFYNAKDLKLLKSIYKKFGTKDFSKFPTFDWKKEMYYKLVKGIKMFYILNYVNYDKDEAMEFLKNKLDWRYYGGKHYESKFTGFAQSYIQPVKFDVDYRKATFSTQICMGTMTRKEAIENLKAKSYNENTYLDEMAYVAKKLGLTTEEFKQILEEPAKSYKNYPNDEKKLEFIYDVYRKLMN
ncbi:MAG: N-acetyl sugar amidotransferase [Chitinophagales bacterium]